MTWFDFPGWGMYELNGVAEKELAATGAHGYPTQAQAKASPNAPPDPPQAGLLQTFNLASLSPAGAAGISGVLLTPHSTGGITGAASNIVKSAVSGLTGQLQVTGIAGWFLRGLKMLFGGVLILSGIGKLTGATNKVVQLSMQAVKAAAA